jgi:polysaccharide biosynthesis transport protein
VIVDNHFNSATDSDFGYGQLLAIFWRRRLWFLTTFSTVLVAAGAFTIFKEPTYESSMQLLVEPNYQNSEGLTDTANRTNQQITDRKRETDYATQLNLMRSQQFIEQVVNSLRSDYPDLDMEEVEEALSLSQVVEDELGTQIFEVVYTDNDPIKTQRVLQTLQSVYQDYNLEQQKLRLERGLTFIDEQLETVRKSLNGSQGQLERFRQNANLVDPEQEAEKLSDALAKVRQQQQDLQAEYEDANDRSMALQRQLRLTPQEALMVSRLSQSTLFQNLLGELQSTEVELSKQQAIYTDSAPEVQVLLDQRQEQLGLLQQEVQRTLGDSASQLTINGGNLLSQGKLSQIDLDLVSQLADTQTNLEGLEAQLRSLAITEQNLRGEFSQFPQLLAEYDRIQPETETTQEILQQLLEERERLSAELAGGGFNWQVVEPPKAGEKLGPQPKLNLMLGIVVGLVLGGIAAFLREAVDGVVRNSEDLKKQTALPLLGVLPELSVSRSSRFALPLPFGQFQAAATTPLAVQWLPFRESLDLIYKNIQLLHAIEGPQSLVVSSALPGEGKSTLVLGLALSAARSGQRVLVIDADLRHSVLHQRLNLPNEHGLSTLLETAKGPFRPQRASILDTQFDLLPAGPESVDPVRLLSSQRFKQLMNLLQSRYDLILIDTPPILGMVDAIQAASVCHGVVMVGRLDRVSQEELKQATTMLNQLNVLGIVANGVKSMPFGYGQDAYKNNKFAVRGSMEQSNEYSQN